MRRRSSSVSGCLFLTSLILILCMVGVAAGAILFGGSKPVASLLGPTQGIAGADRALLRAYLLLRGGSLSQPAGDPSAMAEITVLPGDSAETIIQRLKDAQIVQDPALLRAYLRSYGLDTRIQAGRYALSGEMSITQLAEALQLAMVSQSRLTVPEGWRLEQIAEALPLEGIGFASPDFMQAAQQADGLQEVLGLPSAPSAEGFLFPDTYALGAGTTAEQLVNTMLATFDKRVTPSLRAGFEKQGLSLAQAVVLASIVEREAIVPDERPLIAAVFLNRLQQGIRLEADPTVQYALGRQADGMWWKAPLTLADLELESPYNTYRYSGLPPGPIANPGLSSLQAVAEPAETEFLFFRATCDGSGRHLFASTFDDHLSNACP
ncbi:MAG: endolytic transglycosylase MltG [Anaerolineales bacterium]|nr:endolytic transglycosylase MltG [Anaerolineales bacterium]